MTPNEKTGVQESGPLCDYFSRRPVKIKVSPKIKLFIKNDQFDLDEFYRFVYRRYLKHTYPVVLSTPQKNQRRQQQKYSILIHAGYSTPL